MGEVTGLGLAELPMYLLVGAACGGVAYLFEWTVAQSRGWFKSLEDQVYTPSPRAIGSRFKNIPPPDV
eukprot:3713624-Pyramimonas_sp.AAC.2